VLLEGPPGSGKTLLARALARQAKVPCFEVSASEFVELFVRRRSGSRAGTVEQAGQEGTGRGLHRRLGRGFGRRRGAGSISAGHQEREQTLQQLLVTWTGFQSGRVVV